MEFFEPEDEEEATFKGGIQLPNDNNIPVGDWCFPPLYTHDQHGKVRIWQIGFEVATQELIWIHGIVNGAIQTDRSTIITNQSSRSLQEQAILEARKRTLDKERDGYKFGDAFGVTGTAVELHVQLAKIYYPPGSIHPTNGKAQSCQIKANDFPVWIQVKINGVRGSIRKNNNIVTVLSREGLEYYYLEHIKEEALKLFEFLPNGCSLDAELFIENEPFEKITAAVRTVKIKHSDNHRLKAYIFDLMIDGLVLEDRYLTLVKAYQNYLRKYGANKAFYLVTHTAAYSHVDIDNLHNEAVQLGYEGIVIRWPCWNSNPDNLDKIVRHKVTDKRKKLSLYQGKRNNSLLKYKSFEDAEAIVIGIKSGEGREEGLAIFRLREIKTGMEFNCRPRGTMEQRGFWFQNQDKCLSKKYTFRHVGRTLYNEPLFPTGIGFRDYE